MYRYTVYCSWTSFHQLKIWVEVNSRTNQGFSSPPIICHLNRFSLSEPCLTSLIELGFVSDLMLSPHNMTQVKISKIILSCYFDLISFLVEFIKNNLQMWRNMTSRIMLNSCFFGFHQPFAFSDSLDLTFPTSSAGISSSKANTVVCLHTNLPYISHCCCIDFVLL